MSFFYIVGGDEVKFIRNRKNGINLVYKGYVYRKKATYKNTTNWVCAKAATRNHENKLILCYGRCVTDEKNHMLNVSKKGHNHPPADIDFLEYPKNDSLNEDINFGSYFIETSEYDFKQ